MWRPRSRAFDERGSVIVEAAVIFPVLFLIVFGALEFGLLFKNGLTVSSAVRTGGRALSAQAGKLADQGSMQALIPAASGFRGGLGKVNRVVVYIASCSAPAAYTDPTTNRCAGQPPIKELSEMTGAGAACITNQSVGVDGYCNVYPKEKLTSALADDPAKWGCKTSPSRTLDSYWCPDQRISLQTVGTDYVGLHIEYEHDWVTGLFGSSRRMSDDVVFRVEPQDL